MDWPLFWMVIMLGAISVVAQGMLAFIEGYFNRKQMQEEGIKKGWPLSEHGGVWGSIVIVPTVAYIMSAHTADYSSVAGMFILAVVIYGVLTAMDMYRKGGVEMPEAHAHDGKTTLAGWVLAASMVGIFWILAMFYFGMFTPKVSLVEYIAVSAAASIFFIVGVMKFHKDWKCAPGVAIQVVAEMLLVWMATVIHAFLL